MVPDEPGVPDCLGVVVEDGVMEGDGEEEAVVEGDKDAREDPVGSRSVGVGVGVEQ